MTDKQPNWAEAPADATRWNGTALYPWLKFDIGRYFYWRDQVGWRPYGSDEAGMRHFNDGIARSTAQPEAPTWDGEGLPPVGVRCEYYRDDGRELWHQGRVIGHDGDFAVILDGVKLTGGPYYPRMGDELRPIVTAEQRAAKERDEAVAAMMGFAGEFQKGYPPFEPFWRAFYDAGWRKTAE